MELDKIIAEAYGLKSRNSTAVQKEYSRLISRFGGELNILLELDLATVGQEIDARITEGIKRARAGKLIIKPGFDGRYGEIKLFTEADRPGRQKTLL